MRSKSVIRTFSTNHVTSPFSVDDALSSSRVRSEFGVSRGHVARTRSAFPSAQHGCSFRSFDAPEIYRGTEVAVGSSESARVVYLSRWRDSTERVKQFFNGHVSQKPRRRCRRAASTAKKVILNHPDHACPPRGAEALVD